MNDIWKLLIFKEKQISGEEKIDITVNERFFYLFG